jgi:four helix bundle protein
MDFEEWMRERGHLTREDPLWRVQACRLASYAVDLAWPDVRRLWRSGLTAPVATRLLRALASTGADISEGYSRGSGRDRARFFEYALGSAREIRHWYRSVAGALGHQVIAARTATLNRIIHLLLTMIQRERRHASDARRGITLAGRDSSVSFGRPATLTPPASPPDPPSAP